MHLAANCGEIWISEGAAENNFEPIEIESIDEPEREEQEILKETVVETKSEEKIILDLNKPYEEMSIEELQEAILAKMRKNGPVTDYMLGMVRENRHHGSLVNWVKSFN